MSWISKIIKRKPRFPEKVKHVIIPAFTIGGIQYFQFQDPFNAAYMRGLGAIKYFDDLSMRCNRDYLKLHYEACKAILNQPTKGIIDLNKLNIYNEQLGERLNWITELEYMWNFASVIFFDESESPYDFDMTYNKQKVDRWKKTIGAKDFFLQLPLLQLIPFLKEFDGSLEQWQQTADKLTRYHLENLSSAIPMSVTKNNLLKNSGLPEEMPAASKN